MMSLLVFLGKVCYFFQFLKRKYSVTNKKIIIFAPKFCIMTLQKWIKDLAVHGVATFSIEDVRKSGMYTSEQIMQNELSRLSSNKLIANVYRGFYVIFPVQYMLQRSNGNHPTAQN